MIRLLAATDWPEVKMIFAEGIATGHATFEADPPTWEGFDSGKVAHSRFVAVGANRGDPGVGCRVRSFVA